MKYFVESLPKTCAYCDCCHTKPYDSRHKIDGEKFCGILNEDVEVYYHYSDGRPNWCPLREIPKKNKENYYPDEYMDGYGDGWNACLDEMLSK